MRLQNRGPYYYYYYCHYYYTVPRQLDVLCVMTFEQRFKYKKCQQICRWDSRRNALLLYLEFDQHANYHKLYTHSFTAIKYLAPKFKGLGRHISLLITKLTFLEMRILRLSNECKFSKSLISVPSYSLRKLIQLKH